MLKQLIFEEEGQTLVEYGLLLSLLALVIVAAVSLLGSKVGKYYGNANDQLPFGP